MSNKSLRNIFSDPELWFLILINALLIYFYLEGIAEGVTLIWIYYCQSLLIGIQYFARMIFISKRNTNPRSHPDDSSWLNPESKYGLAFFFALHFGAFHFAYLIFLLVMTAGNGHFDSHLFYYSVLGFAANMIISLTSRVRQDREEKTSTEEILFIPYLRVVPMHFFIIIGFTSAFTWDAAGNHFTLSDSFLIFLLLKTISDILFHIIADKTWLRKRNPVFTNVM